MLVFLIMLLIICFYKTKFIHGKNNYNIYPLRMENVIPLRGIMAIEIVLGHTYGYTGNNLLYFNDRIGVWVVGIFFFLSGYGLMISLHKKENYLDNFLVKRIGSIFIPFLIVFIVDLCLGFADNLFHALLNDWFVLEIIIVYLVWFGAYKYLSEKRAFMFLMVLVVLLNIFGCCYDIGTRWYGSTACFLIGILWEKYEKVIALYIKRNYIKLLFCVSVLFILGGLLFIILDEDNIVVNAILINATCIGLCIIVSLLLMKFDIGNHVTNILGTISWEIYVSHRTILRMYSSLEFHDYFVYMCLLFGGIILVSYFLSIICKKLYGMKWVRH